jgi:hypothetical protein
VNYFRTERLVIIIRKSKQKRLLRSTLSPLTNQAGDGVLVDRIVVALSAVHAFSCASRARNDINEKQLPREVSSLLALVLDHGALA